MDIQITQQEKAQILTLSGKLDAVSAPTYEQQVSALIETAPGSLILDFAGLDYISSAGLRALLTTTKRIKAKGGQLYCVNVQGPVEEVFQISGFSTILPLLGSVAEALADIG